MNCSVQLWSTQWRISTYTGKHPNDVIQRHHCDDQIGLGAKGGRLCRWGARRFTDWENDQLICHLSNINNHISNVCMT